MLQNPNQMPISTKLVDIAKRPIRLPRPAPTFHSSGLARATRRAVRSRRPALLESQKLCLQPQPSPVSINLWFSP